MGRAREGGARRGTRRAGRGAGAAGGARYSMAVQSLLVANVAALPILLSVKMLPTGRQDAQSAFDESLDGNPAFSTAQKAGQAGCITPRSIDSP